MLKQTLFELAIATCLSSDRLADRLKCSLLKHKESFDDYYDKDFNKKCRDDLSRDLDLDYPRQFRPNELQLSINTIWPGNMLKDSAFPALDFLFERLFQNSGDLIHYHSEKVTEFSRFCTRTDPCIIVAWHLASRMKLRPVLSFTDLIRIISAQQPLFSPQANNSEPVAENHAHVGGTHYEATALMGGLFGTEHTSKTDSLLACVTRVAQSLVREGALFEKVTCKEKIKKGSDDFEDKLTKVINYSLGKHWAFEHEKTIDWQLYIEWPVNDEQTHLFLRCQMAKAYIAGNLDKAWLWFWIYLWHGYQHTQSRRLRQLVLFLLQSLMKLRRNVIMDGQGLSRFVDVYNHDLRYNAENSQQQKSSFKRFFQGENDVAEFKVTAGKFSPSAVNDFQIALASVANFKTPNGLKPLSIKQQAIYQEQMERWHYCIHFIRAPKYINNPNAVWIEAKNIKNILREQAKWQTDHLTSKIGEIDSDRLLVPRNFIRGLDVAGDENLVKIEVYAPALRWLRTGLVANLNQPQIDAGFHYSIHAGEDFAHPLSGMRHLDETVEFCEMTVGDRLGHALAIGIDPEYWFEHHGEVVLDVCEHFDNLVWAWHYATQMSSGFSLACKVTPILERRIRSIAPFVPWLHINCLDEIGIKAKTDHLCCSDEFLTKISNTQFFEAMALRRNCYSSYLDAQIDCLDQCRIKIAVPDMEKLKQKDNVAVKIYLKRARWFAANKGKHPTKCKGCKDISHIKKVRIKYELEQYNSIGWHSTADKNLHLIDDKITRDEVKFIHALQDWLIDKCDQKGLILEANPTSNTYIGRFESHADHPIFRWYPPDESTLINGGKHNVYGLRRGPIKVCVNTDDAGIMPTTLRTEFSLLQEAALTHGITRTKAEEWTEKLRVFGLREFNKNHQPLWQKK
ncbi:antiviral RADAR system adenosine deaminase RdrB [Psychromonas hadalis]|uniref:antiviral RADAR system adenosine deaminase RdrB n=1 Tax=Psychromonas hadalis TaxID=211669 RepID=UPI0003B53F77|nr:antiviral RADAR system adenosine deaminase RdrB [Psychromonas hadalis]